MATHKEGWCYSFECDECGDMYDTNEEEFMEAWKECKESGWIVFKDTLGDWTHRCEACKSKR